MKQFGFKYFHKHDVIQSHNVLKSSEGRTKTNPQFT